MILRLLTIFSLAAIVPGATRAPDFAALAAARPAPTDAGFELARLIYPASLNSSIVGYTFETIVGPTYRADPGLKALEAAHPGIIDAMIAAIRPEFERGRTDALPALWTNTGSLYASRLDAIELRQATAFYASPAGLRLSVLEAERLASADETAGEPILRSAPAPQDAAAKVAFDATPAGRKLIALRPQIDAINATWNKTPMPEADARIEAALARVMVRFGVAGRQPTR